MKRTTSVWSPANRRESKASVAKPVKPSASARRSERSVPGVDAGVVALGFGRVSTGEREQHASAIHRIAAKRRVPGTKFDMVDTLEKVSAKNPTRAIASWKSGEDATRFGAWTVGSSMANHGAAVASVSRVHAAVG